MAGLQFGINIDPAADRASEALEFARLADERGLDLLTIQDHPYNRRFLDTWTLLTTLAAATRRIRLGTNVLNLPLRPPAMLSKMAATLDVLSAGRLELGLGAGFYWEGVKAYGGAARTPAEAYTAFEDALHILRGMWDRAGQSFTYEGAVYQVRGARPGPAPAHRIPIWVGATGPRMLRLTGRMADGLLVSRSYVPPERLPDINGLVDEGAQAAGRDPSEIRRGYNLMGTLLLNETAMPPAEGMVGPVAYWVDEIVRLHRDYRQDTFLFWPSGGSERHQIEQFIGEVAPAVRQALGQEISR
jgi:alkanesulfonate monooxygenase SsuD/methylene tetrahydromethanopterin reductase-like flavin-dependent oxidoreductase (luciferase family)